MSNLEDKFNQIKQSLANCSPRSVSNQEVLQIIDLTLLRETATKEEILKLQEVGTQLNVAALCIFPDRLSSIQNPHALKIATVINFPTGNTPQDNVQQSILNVVNQYQVDEIDYVFPYSLYLEGQKAKALSLCEHSLHLCKLHNVTFKVIIETGALPSLSMVYDLSSELIQLGCDFIKTSTGKIAIGATSEAAFAILQAIKDSSRSCGFKASGGIKTKAQALEFIHLGEYLLNRPVNSQWFRLGASSLINDLI
ncbi:2-deoxyribose-5-phosphate aldolase [Legionella impletisoli]|uniref:deoxyribose-phosphate aldolase n=1 Tax=Legionella impletisoli TaxID=343510 RepID=A0A917N7M0_9GAMM|nr:deoxyribose-phosphate aldolase [Legionella impletisoli]GGI75257.1 deoxyribose-phosphate aldolase [Legionella impletisoli]